METFAKLRYICVKYWLLTQKWENVIMIRYTIWNIDGTYNMEILVLNIFKDKMNEN